MTERHPIYSGQATGKPIGYIEDDQAFDLFDRPCATYEGNTGLLRDPKNKAVVATYHFQIFLLVRRGWRKSFFPKPDPLLLRQA